LKGISGSSLTLSFIWTLAASVVYSGSQWLIVIIFAKRGTSAAVGYYAFATAVAYPVSLFANLQLRCVFVTDIEDRFPFHRMLGLRYVLVGCACIILLFVSLYSRSSEKISAMVLLVGASLLIDVLSESYYSVLQKRERMDCIARSQIFRSTLSLATAALALYYTGNIVWAAAGMLCAKCFVLIAYDSSNNVLRAACHADQINTNLDLTRISSTRFLPEWDFRTQVALFRTALPLGFVSIMVSLAGYMPRYVIQHYLGASELGIYSALNYVPQLAVMVATTIGAVTFARLSRFYGLGEIDNFLALLRTSMWICTGLGAIAFLITAIAGRAILELLYRPEYAQHCDLLVWLVLAGGVACMATCLGCAMTAASQFRPQIPLLAGVATVSAVTTIVFVPRLGLTGAAIASLIAMTVQLAGTWFILRRALQLPVTRGLAFGSSVSNNGA
jgi:O-antigen/teichoic acid export membrane protein